MDRVVRQRRHLSVGPVEAGPVTDGESMEGSWSLVSLRDGLPSLSCVVVLKSSTSSSSKRMSTRSGA